MESFGYRLLAGLVTLGVMFCFAAGYFSPSGQVFDVPVSEVQTTLARLPLPPIVLGTNNGDEIPEFTSSNPALLTVKINLLPPPGEDSEERTFKIDARDPNRIVWTYSKDGVEALYFSATIEPVDETSTRIVVDLTGPSQGAFGDMDKKISQNSTIKNLYVTAMREQIAAVLEHRDFNLTSVYPAMFAATAANAPDLMNRINRGIEADHKRIENNIARAYEREGQGR